LFTLELDEDEMHLLFWEYGCRWNPRVRLLTTTERAHHIRRSLDEGKLSNALADDLHENPPT